MSGVNNSPSRPAPTPQSPVDPSKKPSPKPEPEDDGLFRDEQSSGDGWHKTDGPGSGGGYGIRSAPRDSVLRNDSSNSAFCGDLFTDKVDIKFPTKK